MELINLKFQPNVGLGEISFFWNEEDIVNNLGMPEEKEVYEYDDLDYAICLYYNKFGLIFWVHYENNSFAYLSIHLDDIVLDGVRLSLLDKEKLLELIEEFHLRNEYKYFFERTCNIDTGEEFYDFVNIGMSIWFEDNNISDISLQKSSVLRFGDLN